MILALFVSLLLQPTQTMTVADCLLRYDDSTRIIEPSLIAALAGVNTWTEADIDALRYGNRVGTAFVETDTGPRMIWLYQYEAIQYLFVFRHKDAPGAREGTAWHGACMLRLG